jgi:hypothetical protein
MNEPFYRMDEHDLKTIGIKFSGGAPVNESTKKLYGYLFHLSCDNYHRGAEKKMNDSFIAALNY